jgi:aminoglycoside 3-N-acetyltransferase
MDRFERIVGDSTYPLTVERLHAELRELGVEAGMILLIHSSLSSMGWVCGGAQAVIEALQHCVRDYGTLVMPTQTTHLSDPETWTKPAVPREWWDEIRRSMPPFKVESTPSVGMGRIAESFRTQPDTVRSTHPHFSFAAWGAQALEISAEHPTDFGLGDDSPLGRLYRADAWVLLLGAGFDANTSFHLAEHRADYRRKEVVTRHAPVLVDEHRRWKPFRDINIDSSDFEKLGRDFVKHHDDVIRHAKVGRAPSFLFPMRACVDYAASWLHRHRT